MIFGYYWILNCGKGKRKATGNWDRQFTALINVVKYILKNKLFKVAQGIDWN